MITVPHPSARQIVGGVGVHCGTKFRRSRLCLKLRGILCTQQLLCGYNTHLVSRGGGSIPIDEDERVAVPKLAKSRPISMRHPINLRVTVTDMDIAASCSHTCTTIEVLRGTLIGVAE